MAIRKATAEWKGSLQDGKGHMKLGSGVFEGDYSFRSRMGDDTSITNPEELIAAAHAGCYSMALNAALGKAGYNPTSVQTTANVHFTPKDGGFAINPIELETVAVVPGIDEAKFQEIAEDAKKNCPVSKALAAVDIRLKATLKQA
ncbi:osmotically inducible protein OsmC [Thermosporothrix hazakensis]|jgi:osmotically inducible protein OsmC|uniref:Osmotically inducible protein OsmC n=2 Tax=Thermosporothrix TaxID=768650 RepID=A0A326UDN0_THEHA|nr:OsmC family protein [Thermosporothrix hazakensis]PZW32844.1 osmotically inducible protein OsmC [Thermosporothrix hazakensis]BBH90825.1 peroxiredoxin [Thermosporothrix sp. COM3]GCE48875.1 peroxiredoxin [Thermosporothrix hazakensis]